MGEAAAKTPLRKVCKFVIRTYGDTYFGSRGEDELKKEMEVNITKGFLEMMGSIGCFRDYVLCVCL